MSILALTGWVIPTSAVEPQDSPPKADWPLMCDVATIRAGVPEALIYWRAAKGETPPSPSDPDLSN